MKLKRSTLATQLEGRVRTETKAITIGEITLALDILAKAKEQSPETFARLAPLVRELLPA